MNVTRYVSRSSRIPYLSSLCYENDRRSVVEVTKRSYILRKGWHPLPQLTPHDSIDPKIAHVVGDQHEPLLDITLGSWFDKCVEKYGDKEVIYCMHQDVRLSWRDLQRQSDSLARRLLSELKLVKGDRVGVWMPNRLEWLLIKFAAFKAGLVLVNVNPAYRTHEVEHALNLVECKALVISPKFKTSEYGAMCAHLLDAGTIPCRHIIIADVARDLEFDEDVTFNHPDFVSMKDLVFPLLEDLSDQARSPDEPINIQFTSGTTGAPRGAALTHRNILNNGYFIGKHMKMTEEDILCNPCPFYHCFGLVLGNLAAMTHGARLVYPSAAFNATSVIRAVTQERATALHGVPTMFLSILDHPDAKKIDSSRLRTGIMAGSPCPIEVMKRVQRDLNMKEVTIAYGMTETSPVSFQTTVDDPLVKRVETVGRVHPHVEVKIMGDEGQRIAQRGEIGEIWTKGYPVMLGYWNEPGKTEDTVLEDGFIKTGDLAFIDEDGYCHITGRSKDVIIRGGENVYPREVEEYLYRHPDIADVQVVGVPDEKWGEEVCACIILRDGQTGFIKEAEAELRSFCKDQIAHYKVPRYFYFVSDYPLTVTGKIQKYIMRDQMAKIIRSHQT